MSNDNAFEEHQNLNKQAMESASQTIKSALLINGGAAVAVLGFAAKYSDPTIEGGDALGLISGSLLYFSWGVVCTVLAHAFSYFTNFSLAGYINGDSGWRIANIIFHVISVALVLASIGFFILGAYAVRSAVNAF